MYFLHKSQIFSTQKIKGGRILREESASWEQSWDPSWDANCGPFRHLGQTKIFQLPNSKISFTNPFFNSDHPTSIRMMQLATSTLPMPLQLCQCHFNFANATSTSPMHLQLRQRNFNFANTSSTSPMQLQLCQCNFNSTNASSTLPTWLQLHQCNFNFTNATSTLLVFEGSVTRLEKDRDQTGP